jgi:hypothetical protein
MDTAFESSGVQWLVRECPTEKNGTVLQTQTVTFYQHESYGLHRTDAQIFLPGLDVEGRGKMTWTVSLGETRWNFPPEVIVIAQEGHKFWLPLGGGNGHQESAFPHEAGKGQTNRPVLENA